MPLVTLHSRLPWLRFSRWIKLIEMKKQSCVLSSNHLSLTKPRWPFAPLLPMSSPTSTTTHSQCTRLLETPMHVPPVSIECMRNRVFALSICAFVRSSAESAFWPALLNDKVAGDCKYGLQYMCTMQLRVIVI
jgi:hypothetical protein